MTQFRLTTHPTTPPETMSAHTPDRTIYSVSELNHAVRELLEASFPLLWVEGEISNLAQPRSGHWYFSLKDEDAQVRCAMFRNKNRLLRFTPENGMQILVRAKISLYAARGDYQMIVEHMEQAGAGALQRAFEELKAKLAREGLFDEQLKRPLPALPRKIAVITSATGAALQDVLSVLRRRFPMGRVLVYPVPVQGDAAAPAICRALASVGTHDQCDVALLVRGGGSLEDLWAFNEEAVARAIRACAIPVVAGVGHEVDISIADFAADLRAPTPSAAAELVCPDLQLWPQQLQTLQRRLEQHSRLKLTQAQDALHSAHQRLRRLHPERRLHEQMQRLDELEQRLRRSMSWLQQSQTANLQQFRTRLTGADPRGQVRELKTRNGYLEKRIRTAMQRQLQSATTRWQGAARELHAVSPLNTLERGYAIAATGEGRVLTTASGISPGDSLRITLRRGQLDCQVKSTHPQSDNSRG